MKKNERYAQSGFSLIELMIAIAIVAVLARLAIPAYMENIAKAKRADGESALLGLAQAMERLYANTGSYCTAAGGTATSCSPGDPAVIFAKTVPTGGGTPYYNLKITVLTPNSYTLQAQRTGSMANDKCGTLTLTAAGVQDITGGAGGIYTKEYCWKK